jgi:hypothetical protein
MSEANKVSKHQFYFETPLYEPIDVGQLEGKIFEGDVDAYSARNGIDTTYEITSRDMGYGHEFDMFMKISLQCKRKKNDVLVFFVYMNDTEIIKVGQLPSLATIQFATLGKKYDKHMDRKDLQEFKKAIGLAAHGVGVGSFVYLRRIFGNLIENAYVANKDAVGLDEKKFHELRMADRVTALVNFLPSQLVEMKALYPILSKGLHELDEEECLAYFPALQLAVELILDQKIEQDLKVQRDAAVKKQLQEIAAKMQNSVTAAADQGPGQTESTPA